MDTLKIVLAPDPFLREQCEPCEIGDPTLKPLANKMTNTMYANHGCGLAAPQVGVKKRIIVVDCDDPENNPNPIVLVNPEIIALDGSPVKEEEGCLSCPGISVPVTRQPFARVRYYDLDGNECTIEGKDLLGRCLQHEIDHLNGKTLFESCNALDRIRAIHEYKQALARGAKPGEVE